MSDAVQTGDLLRFYTPNGLKPVDSSTISYTKQMDQLKQINKKMKDKSTSLYKQKGNKSTADLFKTPSYKELHPAESESSSSSSSGEQSQAALQRNNNNPYRQSNMDCFFRLNKFRYHLAEKL